MTSLAPSFPCSRLCAKLTSSLFFTMIDLITFKTQVKIIVNNLTQTLMAQIFTTAEKTTLNIQSPKAQVS